MNEVLLKSLTEVIDEAILELDELKKNAPEIKIGEDKSLFEGHPVNGSLMKEEDEDEGEDDEDEDEGEDDEDEGEDDEDEGEEDEKPEPKSKPPFMKSQKEIKSLIKSEMDHHLGKLNDTLAKMGAVIQQLGQAPKESKGQTFKQQPLTKSENKPAEKALNKSEIIDKLFELQKSNKANSMDIIKAEGSLQGLKEVATKFNLG